MINWRATNMTGSHCIPKKSHVSHHITMCWHVKPVYSVKAMERYNMWSVFAMCSVKAIKRCWHVNHVDMWSMFPMCSVKAIEMLTCEVCWHVKRVSCVCYVTVWLFWETLSNDVKPTKAEYSKQLHRAMRQNECQRQLTWWMMWNLFSYERQIVLGRPWNRTIQCWLLHSHITQLNSTIHSSHNTCQSKCLYQLWTSDCSWSSMEQDHPMLTPLFTQHHTA